MARTSEPSPYVEFDRSQWRSLRMSTPLKLTESELLGLRGLGEQLDLLEVEEVYLPLARLIHLQGRRTPATLRDDGRVPRRAAAERRPPGALRHRGGGPSVAVGKVDDRPPCLQALLARWEHHPRVDLVTTDGFLYPNAELQRRKPHAPQGVFPESYDRRGLMRFVTAVKSGSDQVCAPVYSHLLYDIVSGEKMEIKHPGHPHPRGAQRAADRPPR